MQLTWKEAQKEIKKELRAPKKICGHQLSALLNYCEYVWDIIYDRNLHKPYHHISLLDKELLKKHNITTKRSYRYLLSTLEDIGVLSDRDTTGGNSIERMASTFTIDVEKLISILVVLNDKHSLFYSDFITYNFCECSDYTDSTKSHMSSICTSGIVGSLCDCLCHCNGCYWFVGGGCSNKGDKNSHISKITFHDIEPEELYEFANMTSAEWYIKNLHLKQSDPNCEAYNKLLKIFSQMDNINIDSILPFDITTSDKLDKEEEKLLKGYYLEKVEQNKWYRLAKDMAKRINPSLPKEAQIRITPKVHICHFDSNHREGYRVWFTCRQSNDLCKLAEKRELLDEDGDKTYQTVNVKERTKKLEEEGFIGNFDLHSAIFGVAKLMNTGEYESKWDIKKEISALGYEGISKPLLFRIFFSDSFNQMWSKYCHACYHPKQGEPVKTPYNKDRLHNLYDWVQGRIGGSHEFQTNIFLIESILELMVIQELTNRGYDVRNVYDCFWYKPTQTSMEEVTSVIDQKAVELYNEYVVNADSTDFLLDE